MVEALKAQKVEMGVHEGWSYLKGAILHAQRVTVPERSKGGKRALRNPLGSARAFSNA